MAGSPANRLTCLRAGAASSRLFCNAVMAVASLQMETAMARGAVKETFADDIKIEQKDNINLDDDGERSPEIVRAEKLPEKEFLDELMFYEEPVTIRLEPTTDKNAPIAFPVWVNGKGCEVWDPRKNQWVERPFLPIGMLLTIKRKYLEVIARAKTDTVSIAEHNMMAENPGNLAVRRTSAVQSFSIIEDKNPRGGAWMSEIRRRNF